MASSGKAAASREAQARVVGVCGGSIKNVVGIQSPRYASKRLHDSRATGSLA
jgi:hypothetical protein